MNSYSQKKWKDQSGGLAIDFIFAITIVMGATAVFFAVSFSLSIIEVSQYIGFASARSYFSGHLDPQAQSARAEMKFQQLINSGIFKNLYKSSGWFDLKFVGAQNFESEYTENRDFVANRDVLTGVRLSFEADMLNLDLPLIGPTAEESFKADINNYLGREVSFNECLQFVQERYKALLGLGYTVPEGGRDAYIPLVDNGC